MGIMSRPTGGRLLRHLVSIVLTIVLAIALAIAASCGVPTDGSPSLVAIDDVSGLAAPDNFAEATPTPEGTQLLTGLATVYFVNADNRLEPEQREVVLLTDDERAKPILEALIVGPNEEERNILGLVTGLPDDIVILDVELKSAGSAVVNIADGSIRELSGDNFRIALAQIVYTMTELDGIESFRLLIDGEEQPLSTDTGITDAVAPVTRNDYASYRPGQVAEPVDSTVDSDADNQPLTDPDGDLVPTPEANPEPTATPLPTPLASPEPEPTEPATPEPESTPLPTSEPESTPEDG